MAKTEKKPGGNGKKPSGNVVELPKQAASDPRNDVTAFVRDHPMLVVAGGVALGVVAAAMLPKGTTRRLARRAASLAEVAGAAGVLIGNRARDTAEAAGADLRERGEAVADRLEELGGTAAGRLGQFGGAASARIEKLIDPVESAASRVAKKAAELRSRVRH
jgi:hypothetical protein